MSDKDENAELKTISISEIDKLKKISESDYCEFITIFERDGELVASFSLSAYDHFYVPVDQIYNRMDRLRDLGINSDETQIALTSFCAIETLWDQGVFKRYKALPVVEDGTTAQGNSTPELGF